MRSLHGLETLGNEHPVTRCDIPEQKPSIAPLQNPQNLQKEILSSVLIQNKNVQHI